MTEPRYRILFGSLLLVFLYTNQLWLIYFLCALLAFEAISNEFIPQRVHRLLHGKHLARMDDQHNPNYRFDLEADRVTRMSIAILLLVSLLAFPEILWILPWLIGLNIVLAGIMNACPTTMLYQKIGLR